MAREHPKSLDAVGVVPEGRLTFALTSFLTAMHAKQLGITIVPAWGPIWTRAVQTAVENALRHDKKYVLFFDGDGAWDVKDVLELYDIIEHETVDERPIDAVFPVQACRNTNKPLVHDWRPAGNTPEQNAAIEQALGPFDYTQRYSRVIHAHFGLTFVRAQALREVAMPWFATVPGANGSYRAGTPGQMDPDTYFWMNFAKHDRVVVQANQVVVGHIELNVRWQQGPRVLCQSINDFITGGKPEGLRAPLVEEMTAEALAAPPVAAEEVASG